MKRDIIILMTACINPKGMTQTVVQDNETRKKQYFQALDYYLQSTNYNVVFVENSNTDISTDYEKSIDSGRLEIITFDGNDYNKRRGKGYGEGCIIDYAMKHSRIINDNPNSTIVKVTGRHLVKNVKSIINLTCMLCPGKQYVCAHINNKVKATTSDLYLGTNDFHRLFSKMIDKIDESQGRWYEHVLYSAMMDYSRQGGEIIQMPIPLKQDGRSGSTGDGFASPTIIDYLKTILKSILFRYGFMKIGKR